MKVYPGALALAFVASYWIGGAATVHASAQDMSALALPDPPVTVPQPPFWNSLMLGPCDRLDPTGIQDDCTCSNASNFGMSVSDQSNFASMASSSASKKHGQRHSIQLHSGQEVYTETDLFIKGQDSTTDIAILRRYTSRGVGDGESYGPGWSLN